VPVGIVYSDDSGVFWTDLTSGALQALTLGAPGSSRSLHGSTLVTVRGHYIELVKLDSGAVSLVDTGVTDTLVDAQAFWSADGSQIVYAGWVEPDPEADVATQRLVLCVLTADGSISAPVAYSGPPAMPLGYDDISARLLLWGPDTAIAGLQLLAVDPSTGQHELVATLPGVGELALGPNGSLAWLAQEHDRYQLMTGSLDGAATRALPLESGDFATQLTWSPNGRYVAFLLRKGELYDPEAQTRGLYVLDTASALADGPLAEALPDARIVGWTPDSEQILLRNQSSDALYYESIDLEGVQRLLPLKGAATVLGWLAQPETPADAPALDGWRGRFLSAAGDSEATAAAAASYISAYPKQSLAETAAQLRAYYVGAGWPDAERRVLQLDDSLFALQAPPTNIVLATDGSYVIVGQGETLRDARLDENAAGRRQVTVIYDSRVGGATQWAVSLLQETDGAWEVVWQPAGHRDWVTTDGVVSFLGKGIATFQVEGTSLGLPAEPFLECAECPLRQLTATWRLQGAAYVRDSTLTADAPLTAVHWEMTKRTPYALVYEAVRRVRAGEPFDELASSPAAQELLALELDDAGLRLVVTEVTDSAVTFGPADDPDRLRAIIRNGRIVEVARQ